MSFIDTVKAFLAADAEVKRLDGELKAAKMVRGALTEKALEAFAEAGVSNMNVDGNTVYLFSQVWARSDKEHRPAVIEALKATGHDDFIREDFSTQSVSAMVREYAALVDGDLDRLGEVMAPELVENLSITRDYDVRVRKA